MELGMTVGELDSTMSTDELSHWKALAKLQAEESEHRQKMK
jgi:hypothetical protein